MSEEKVIDRFNRLWNELNGGRVPPPTAQQLLGVVIVMLDSDEGRDLWTDMVTVTKNFFGPFIGQQGRDLWERMESAVMRSSKGDASEALVEMLNGKQPKPKQSKKKLIV